MAKVFKHDVLRMEKQIRPFSNLYGMLCVMTVGTRTLYLACIEILGDGNYAGCDSKLSV